MDKSVVPMRLHLAGYLLTVTQVNDFVGLVRGKESFYGLKEETTDSLLLSMLPTEQRTYQPYEPKDDPVSGYAIDLVCLQELIRAFRTSAGFHIPTVSMHLLNHASSNLFYGYRVACTVLCKNCTSAYVMLCVVYVYLHGCVYMYVHMCVSAF